MKIQADISPIDATLVASAEITVVSSVTPTPTVFSTTGTPLFWNSAVGTVLTLTQVNIDPQGVRTEPSDPFVLTVAEVVVPTKPGAPTAKVVGPDDPSLPTI